MDISFQELLQEQGSNQKTLLEIEGIQLEREETLSNESLNEIGMPIAALILIYAGIVVTWLVFAFGAKSIRKFAKTSLTACTKLHPIPCRNCHYFTKNFYLQCAVHPSEVLTSQAIGCSDYCPEFKSFEK